MTDKPLHPWARWNAELLERAQERKAAAEKYGTPGSWTDEQWEATCRRHREIGVTPPPRDAGPDWEPPEFAANFAELEREFDEIDRKAAARIKPLP